MLVFRILVFTFTVFTTITVAALEYPEEVRYQWKYLNYTWPSAKVYQKAVKNGDYIPINNIPSGIKIWKDKLYLAIPRLRHGVPATLAVTPLEPVDGNRSPNIRPYPNWQMQTINDCNAFQTIRKMEIDPRGRMWILDSGHHDVLEIIKPVCPPRLVILDLENNGKVLVSYLFPATVVSQITNLINDLVLDHTDGGYAYIADADPLIPSIVVFSLEQRKSWKITHKSMYLTAPFTNVKNDSLVLAPFNIDGIALSAASREGQRLVYYSPLASYQLFSIPTDVLKRNPEDFGSQMKKVGEKPSQTDGMMISADDELYFGLLTKNEISKWNTNEPPFSENQQQIFKDDTNLVWPDTFAIDEEKTLWVSTNRLDKTLMLIPGYNINEINCRVVKLAQIDSMSYQYYSNGTAPKWPKIE